MMNSTYTSIKDKITDMLIPSDATIREVMKTIDIGGLGIALLVDPKTFVFQGVMTDGDIRRALLKGEGLDALISCVEHPETITAELTTPAQDLAGLFNKKIRVIPILDHESRVVDLAVFDNRFNLPISEPSFEGNELKYVSECVLTGWVSSAGKFVTQFEDAFSRFCGAEYGISSSSGTTALHLSLAALGLGPDDEVIVPSFTFISTANAVAFTGATPVFVDSEKSTWNIDPREIEKAVTDKTRAIIPVHLYGHPANMDPIIKIARKYGLFVIEDAAEAHGALYKKHKVGALGDMGVFSFYGNKTITTGEGGMVVTNNKDLADKIRILRDHGMDSGKKYVHSVLGYNYRMTNIQAAIGVAQMERINQIIEQKRFNAKLYIEKLKEVPGIILPPDEDWAYNIYWLFSIIIDPNKFGMSAYDLQKKLAEKKIETRPLFPPIHHQPIYQSKDVLPVCQFLAENGLSLPSSANLRKNDIIRVADELAETYHSSKSTSLQ